MERQSFEEDGWVEDSAISFEGDVEMGAGGAAGGADLGDGLTGKDVGADLERGFADKMAVADGEVAVLEFDKVARPWVVANREDFTREHGIDGCTGLG